MQTGIRMGLAVYRGRARAVGGCYSYGVGEEIIAALVNTDNNLFISTGV